MRPGRLVGVLRVGLLCGLVCVSVVSLAQPDLKAKLRQAAGTDRADTKARLRAAAEEAPADGWAFSKDRFNCSYLTKPMVRLDGGGMDTHVGGQALCHRGRLMHCLGGRWNDRGRCPGASFPQAWQVEGTSPDGQPNPDDVSVPPSDPADPTASGSGGAPVLIGESPEGQRLRQEQDELEERQRRLDTSDPASRPGAGGRPGSVGEPAASNAADCAKGRAFIASVDDSLRKLEAYSRTQRSDGQISTAVSAQYEQLRSTRGQAQAKLQQLQCK